MTTIARRGAIVLLLAWFIPAARSAAEAHMGVHMVVHLPCIALLGGLVAGELPEWVLSAHARHDFLGTASLTFAAAVLSFWMIPVALDASLLWGGFSLAKYSTLLLSGVALRSAWRRAPPALLMFMLGNLAWMLATAGLLFQQAESRLCVSYLADQQEQTGSGLTAWGIVVGAIALGQVIAGARRRDAGAHVAPTAHASHTVEWSGSIFKPPSSACGPKARSAGRRRSAAPPAA